MKHGGLTVQAAVDEGLGAERGVTSLQWLLAPVRARLGRRSVLVYGWRSLLLAVFLAGWQWVPDIPGIRGTLPILDPFIISSPQRIAVELWNLCSGSAQTPTIWPYLGITLEGTGIGVAGGVLSGALLGLVLSNSQMIDDVLRPFINALNAIPRIALIPIAVIIFGTTVGASAAAAWLLVIFIVFFNAYEGGRAIDREVVFNAVILGAKPRDILLRVRLPYVLAWTFAALPNAVSFGLVGVVTSEILTGVPGVGALLVVALDSVQSTITFAVVVILAAVGVALVVATSALRRRVLFWWDQ